MAPSPIDRPSKFDRLPRVIREQAEAMRADGKTLSEIIAYIDQACIDAGVDDGMVPSHSGVGRHFKGLSKIVESARMGRAIAGSIVGPLSREPESRQSRANIEILQALVMQLLGAVAEDGEPDQPVTIDPKLAALLARTMRSLAGARKDDALTTIALDLAKREKNEGKGADEDDSAEPDYNFHIPGGRQ